MAMAPTIKVVLGAIAFVVFWVLAVFPAVPFMPIGRTAGSLLGAMLMVLFRVITPDQAYSAIDLPIIGLLFGTMVVSVYLERADMFKYLGKLLAWKSLGPKDLLCRICLLSAISSAFFTNDTSCVVLTEFVLKIARQHNLPPHPFLLALSTSANIGSSATPIGNPQNLVIAVRSKISFGDFLFGVFPSMIVGVSLNAAILLCMYWKLLSVRMVEEDPAVEVANEEEVVSHRFSPATLSHSSSLISQEQGSNHLNGLAIAETLRNRLPSLDGELESGRGSNASKEDVSSKWKRIVWKTCVYLVALGMLVSMLMGLNMSWTAISAALALVIIDFRDAKPSLEKVSYSILIFFCGMFITVEGFNSTGIPSAMWEVLKHYSKIDHAGGIAVLAAIILVLSNVASNVPTVLLLASAATMSPESDKKAWLILAWVSTVAGNLSLSGSAANLIVCEQARGVPIIGYNLSFWNHLKFGVPSTLIVTAFGLVLISFVAWSTCGGISFNNVPRKREESLADISLGEHGGSFWNHLKFGVPSTLIVTAVGLALIR